MRKVFPDYFLITLKGLAMGAADVVPGVSGGTVAFIAGIYEELIDTINNVDIKFFKNWKEQGLLMAWNKMNGNFLVALLLGIGISILSFAKLITYLLKTHPIVIWSFFFGLIIASVVYMFKEITQWKWNSILALMIGTAFAYFMTILSGNIFFNTINSGVSIFSKVAAILTYNAFVQLTTLLLCCSCLVTTKNAERFFNQLGFLI